MSDFNDYHLLNAFCESESADYLCLERVSMEGKF